MLASHSLILDLFNSLMHRLGVRLISDDGVQERPKEEMKLDLLLQEEIFWKEKPQLGLIGKIKAGKSTLGNAMFTQAAFEAGDTTILAEKASSTISPFKTGEDLEVTEKVSVKTLPSGIVVWDTPGFKGFSGYEKQTQDLMSQCDLLLHVVRYPGSMDTSAIETYEKEIKPYKKRETRVITVINIDESIPLEKAEPAITKFRTKANLPDTVHVYALSGDLVGTLLSKMIDYLPDKYYATFSDALDVRYQRDMRNYISYNLSLNAAATAACTSVTEDFTDKKLRARLNKIVLISAGLPLKIASIYDSDFDISEQIKIITRELASNRYANTSVTIKTGPLTALGAVTGIALTASAAQSPVIAALLVAVGLAASPLSIAIVAALAATAGGILANNLTGNLRQPKLGGFDIAIGVLAHGYTTLATILAQEDGKLTLQESLKFYEETFQHHYHTIIRGAFDLSAKLTLENATEGDRIKVMHQLSENKELRKIFANVNQASEAMLDFGVSL